MLIDILSKTAIRGATPTLAQPVVGQWYCGMNFESDGVAVMAGELMRFDGDNAWTNEQEDDEGREPNPSDYDYLQEQI